MIRVVFATVLGRTWPCLIWLAATALPVQVLSAQPALAAAPCGWSQKLSADTRNLLFIDRAAVYWTGRVAIPKGGRLEIDGRFPHARYMSLVVYDERARTIDHLTDVEIDPAAGATNPFRTGSVRTAADRRYTVHLLNQRAPAQERPPNTLYTERADGSRTARTLATIPFTLRVYAPDLGQDELGDAPLPTLTLVDSSGSRTALPTCPGSVAPVPLGVLERLAARLGSEFEGQDPPTWRLFLPNGLGENIDNSYVHAAFAPRYGEVLLIRAKAPTFPSTRDGAGVMLDGQLRYWSFCTHRLTTEVLECAIDEDFPLSEDGRFALVISTPEHRPANARPECGFVWLAAASAGPSPLVYRHMAPAPDFAEAIQRTSKGSEREDLGEYFPEGRYYKTVADFETLGCGRSPAGPKGRP